MPSLSVKETRQVRAVGTRDMVAPWRRNSEYVGPNVRVTTHSRRKLDDNLAPLVFAAYH
jgi:hypothetical protein